MTIRRIIRLWQAWRQRREVARKAPEIFALQVELATRRKRHQATRSTMAAIREAMTERLRGELQR